MMSWEEMKIEVQSMMGEERWEHTLGVVTTAEDLAQRYGESLEKVQIAGLLHDCAKDLPRNNLLKFIEDFGIVLDRVEADVPSLWHAPVGAVLAHKWFGVEDTDILAAIRYHTVGRARMSRLEKIIYVADMIEPQRQFPEVDRLRSLSRFDLDQGCLAAFDASIRYVIQKGVLLHPGTVEARNELLRGRR